MLRYISMKKYFTPLALPPLAQMVAYFIIFTAEVTILELVRQFAPLRSNLSIVLCFGTIAISLLVSGLFICKQNAFSRTVSVSTVLVLSTIALHFTDFPAYFLPLVLGAAYIGSRSFLHRRSNNTIRTIVCSACVAMIALTISFAITIGTLVVTHIIMASYLPL